MGKNNQITYTVKKTPVNQKVDLFVMVQFDEYMNALNDLSGNAFKVWAYMAKNKAEYTEELSRKYVMKKCNFKETAYKNAIDELKEKGYLIDDNIHHNKNLTTNFYLFCASPRKETENKDIQIPFTPIKAGKTLVKPPPVNDEYFDFD